MINVSFLGVSVNCNGPGRRLCIWFQGCDLGCNDCFNPHTHSQQGNQLYDVRDLVRYIIRLRRDIDLRGITLSGGEPLQQPNEVLNLLMQIPSDLDVLLFTGYTVSEIIADPIKSAIIGRCDAVLSGRYKSISGAHPLSCKNLLIVSDRIQKHEISVDWRVEFVVSPDNMLLTGFPQLG